MAIDVSGLPDAAEQLQDLTAREREVLELVRAGANSREIAQRLSVQEATVYRLIADLLDALEFTAPRVSAAELHARGGTRPASSEEAAAFLAEFGPFETDDEG